MNLAASRSLSKIASLSASLLLAALFAGPSGLAEETNPDFFEAKIRPLFVR